MLHRQALASRNISEELQTIFKAVISVAGCVKNTPLRERLKNLRLYGDRTHGAPILL
jgi:hypothetical protein